MGVAIADKGVVRDIGGITALRERKRAAFHRNGRADNANSADLTVNVACNETDKSLCCLGFNRQVFKEQVFYVVCLGGIVISAAECADNAEEADDFNVVMPIVDGKVVYKA